MVGVEIPVVPVRRQMAVTTPIPEISLDYPFVIDFAKNLYFHREADSLGMSNVTPVSTSRWLSREMPL
jgi:sarcosine oxidase subunit beta